MVDSCATCFFFRAFTASRQELVGLTTCRNAAPDKNAGPSSSPWAQVFPDEWCGDGKDATTQRPFSPKAYSPASPTSTGTFAMAAANTVNVVDAACTTASVVSPWVISGSPPGIRFTMNVGSFDVFTNDGSNTTATWGYLLY